MPRLRRWLRIWLGIEEMEGRVLDIAHGLAQSSPTLDEGEPASWLCSDADLARQERQLMRRRYQSGEDSEGGLNHVR